MPSPRRCVRLDRDHAVARNLIARNAFDRQHRAVQALEHVNELFDRRRVGIDHVVAQDDGERLVADQLARHQHRMPETERFALPDVGEVDHVRDLADLGELLSFAAGFEKRFEFDGDVEMIFDRILPAARDQDDVVDTCRDGFLDAVLNDRLVDQREHLLGLRFGCGKEPRPRPAAGKTAFRTVDATDES